MILENGLIRTLDRQIPTQRALAIAGERVAGGVGVHEPALASPEVVDLGGRGRRPGLQRRARALSHLGARRGRRSRSTAAARSTRRSPGCATRRGSRARSSAATAGAAATGGRHRADGGAARRGHGPTRRRRWSRRTITRSGSTRPRSRSAGGDLEVEGGVVERDARGEPTGVLREEAAWRFRERHLRRARRRVPRGDARRAEGRGGARRHRGARQGRLARGAPALAAARGARAR